MHHYWIHFFFYKYAPQLLWTSPKHITTNISKQKWKRMRDRYSCKKNNRKPIKMAQSEYNTFAVTFITFPMTNILVRKISNEVSVNLKYIILYLSSSTSKIKLIRHFCTVRDSIDRKHAAILFVPVVIRVKFSFARPPKIKWLIDWSLENLFNAS